MTAFDPEAWSPPHCAHGNIILGCPHDDCVEQNAYLAGVQAGIDAYNAELEFNARTFVRGLLGLPVEVIDEG